MNRKHIWTETTGILVVAGMLLLGGFAIPVTGAVGKVMPPQAEMVPATFSQIAESARPGVVNIRTVKTTPGGGRVFRHFFGAPPNGRSPFDGFFGHAPDSESSPDLKQESLGSGFIVDPKGYIVTNNHVIDGAEQITVRLADGKEAEATLVGRDPKTDLALVKIDPPETLTALPLGDSDAAPVGSWVVAIGSPFGLEQTVTTGIISAKGRVIGAGPYDDFLQTDASINPGNSGGPLLNLKGEVIGINTAIIARGQGIGFAIPTSLAKGILAQLREDGQVTRGWIGVGIQDLDTKMADYYGIGNRKGVLVTQVYKGDPAEKAGIRAKDIIISVKGKPVSSGRELSRLVAETPVGSRVPMVLWRNGKEESVTVRIAKRSDAEAVATLESDDRSALGLQLAELTPEYARRLGLDETEHGIVVVGVKNGSKAFSAGLQRGDLIKEINRKPVSTVADFKAEWKKIDKGKTAQLLVKRPSAGFLVITLTA
jgi:serine protease Do